MMNNIYLLTLKLADDDTLPFVGDEQLGDDVCGVN